MNGIAMSDLELREEAMMTAVLACTIARSGNGNLAPVLRVLHRKGDGQLRSSVVGISGTLSRDQFARQYAFYHLGCEVGRIHGMPLALVFHAQGWMVLDEPESTARACEHPNRVESLAVCGITSDGRSCAAIFEMRRRTDDSIVLVQFDSDDLRVVDINEKYPCIHISFLDAFLRGAYAGSRIRQEGLTL